MMRLSADDIGLWRRAMRDVAPLPGRPVHPRPGPRALDPLPALPPLDPLPDPPPLAREGRVGAGVGKKAVGAGVNLAAHPSPGSDAASLDRFAGLDRTSAERLKRGRYPVEARLDLHGMTQAEAHRALAGFVARSRMAGRRCTLVITGHGRLSGGVLKAAVPRWLAEPEMRPHVLAITPAQLRDGGSGALYLLLRKASR